MYGQVSCFANFTRTADIEFGYEIEEMNFFACSHEQKKTTNQ